MATKDLTVTSDQRRVATSKPAGLAPRPPQAVLWWAGFGAIVVAVQVYAFTRWLVDLPPNTPAGPTDVPGFMRWNIHAQEVLWPTITLVALCFLIGRPLLRRQPVSWDGIFVTAFLTCLWQNFGINWLQPWSSYNAVVINRGSWYNFVPFWTSPEARQFAEAPFWNVGFYGIWGLLTLWLCLVMRAVSRRWPHLSRSALFGVMCVFAAFLDLAAESLWVRGGMYHYGGAPRGWSLLFEGHYYQFPIVAMVLAGVLFAATACVRYYRDDKGESFAERGLENLRIGRKGKVWVRWLALVGIVNALFLGYNLSMAAINFRYGGSWPEDIQKRSYFTQEICGAKTDRACTGPGVPTAKPDSAYLTPDGTLGHPSGWKAPVTIPFAD